MNFLDTYDIASPPTPTPNTSQQPTQSLNEEVTQVVGQLSRFWGGFRKQSQSVFEAAKKDLGDAYTQAQKEISKLTIAEPSSSASSSSAAHEDTDVNEAPKDGTESVKEKFKDVEDKDASESNAGQDDEDSEEQDTPDTVDASTSNNTGHSRTASQNFFHRLQSSLPANLVASVQNVQNQLPEALRHGGSVDFTQLRTTLTTEFQRVQGITRAQAEEYVHKSEDLLREAQEFLKDAVKVVPPEEAQGRGGSVAPAGMLWDGSDLWLLPDVGGPSAKGKEKEVDGTAKTGAEGLRAVATRAESLLKQLRHDAEIIKVDPTADERAKVMYEQWIRDKVEVEEGGITGNHWSDATVKALGDPVDGSALKTTHDVLVPEHITDELFWTRYFFRVYQVEQDEQRRKALIQATMTEDEDFSWEDDDEEAASPATAKPTTSSEGAASLSLRASIDTLQAPPAHGRQSSEQSSPRTSEAQSSRRQSSEGSYDVVSSQVSTSGDPPVEKKPKEEGEDEEDDDEEEEDSDWE